MCQFLRFLEIKECFSEQWVTVRYYCTFSSWIYYVFIDPETFFFTAKVLRRNKKCKSFLLLKKISMFFLGGLQSFRYFFNCMFLSFRYSTIKIYIIKMSISSRCNRSIYGGCINRANILPFIFAYVIIENCFNSCPCKK